MKEDRKVSGDSVGGGIIHVRNIVLDVKKIRKLSWLLFALSCFIFLLARVIIQILNPTLPLAFIPRLEIVKTPTLASFTYTVQRGDTLWSIARRFNTHVRTIREVNHLAADEVRIGQKLRIPITTTSTATSLTPTVDIVTPTTSSIATPEPVPEPEAKPSTNLSELLPLVYIPTVTATISLLTAITSTVISFRKDRLETKKAELEFLKLQLEYEKLKKDTEIEIERKQHQLDELRDSSRDKQNNQTEK